MYLPAIDAMIDASEFAPFNVIRWGVPRLRYLMLTHWHSDHTHGVRLLAMRAADQREDETFIETKRRTAPTVVTTREVYDRTCEQVGPLMDLVEDRGWADVHFLDERPLTVDGLRVRAVPYPLREGGPADATAFVVEEIETTLAVVADDARYLDEGSLPDDIDLLVSECGHFTHDPAGKRIRSPDVEADDLSYEEVRDRVRRVDPDRAYPSHQYARVYDDFAALEAEEDAIRCVRRADRLCVTGASPGRLNRRGYYARQCGSAPFQTFTGTSPPSRPSWPTCPTSIG